MAVSLSRGVGRFVHPAAALNVPSIPWHWKRQNSFQQSCWDSVVPWNAEKRRETKRNVFEINKHVSVSGIFTKTFEWTSFSKNLLRPPALCRIWKFELAGDVVLKALGQGSVLTVRHGCANMLTCQHRFVSFFSLSLSLSLSRWWSSISSLLISTSSLHLLCPVVKGVRQGVGMCKEMWKHQSGDEIYDALRHDQVLGYRGHGGDSRIQERQVMIAKADPKRKPWKESKGIKRRWRIVKDLIGSSEAHQRKFRNPTSDYTESCHRRSVNQEMWSRRCDTAQVCEMRTFCSGRNAQNAAFFRSFVALPARKVSS